VRIFVEYSVKFAGDFGRNAGNKAGKIRKFHYRIRCQVWSSYPCSYEGCCRLGPDALLSGRFVPTFRCNVLLVHSVSLERCHLFIKKPGNTSKKIARFTCPYASCRDVFYKNFIEYFTYAFISVTILVVFLNSIHIRIK
jgi:hypothetical protein